MRSIATLVTFTFFSAHGWAEPSQSKEIFRWKGAPAGATQLHLRNVNGPIEIRPSSGTEVEVTAKAVWRGSVNPDQLVVARKAAGANLSFCVMVKDQQGICEADGRYQSDHGGVKNLGIELLVLVPAGMTVDAKTVNGGLQARLGSNALNLETQNGAIDANTQGGPSVLRSSNGSMHVTVDKGDLDVQTENGRIVASLGAKVSRARLQTINGTVSVTRARGVGAEVQADTVNGHVMVDGRSSGKTFKGRVGAAGGPRIEATTVNGSVDVEAR